jgi:hypothetical protein
LNPEIQLRLDFLILVHRVIPLHLAYLEFHLRQGHRVLPLHLVYLVRHLLWMQQLFFHRFHSFHPNHLFHLNQ